MMAVQGLAEAVGPLAGGIAAALLRRARTGEGAIVDVALLGTAMWSLQMSIVGAAAIDVIQIEGGRAEIGQ